MSRTKTVLFVTYGGGHATMVIPIIRQLQANLQLRIETLALTTAQPKFKQEGLPYYGYKDFLLPQDEPALRYGRELAKTQHRADSGIDEAESIAYLGLCYAELAQFHGETGAKVLWDSKGRQAFLPLGVLERVIQRIQPDIVVTTNSPRSEQAAVEVAKQHGIPTLSMVDLFGYLDFHVLDADYLTVLSERTIDNLHSEGVKVPRDHCFVTGNPAFDHAFDYRGPINYAWRKQHFPKLADDKKCLLWIDMPAYFHGNPRTLWVRSEDEVLEDLENLADAARANNCALLVRPHPSQGKLLHAGWVEQAGKDVYFAGDVPLYPLLNAVDVVALYSSTVSVEAMLMGKRVIQLKYKPGQNNMPLGEWGLAWNVLAPQTLSSVMKSALYDEAEWQRIRQRIAELLPQEKATPKVAAIIEKILAN